MVQVTVKAISEDGQVLKCINGTFLPPETYIRTPLDEQAAVELFVERADDMGVHVGYKASGQAGARWTAIFRKPAGSLKYITGSSEKENPYESPLRIAIREFAEETGNIIPARFFNKVNSNTFCLKISNAAKQTILDNYRQLIPLTEIFDLHWEAAGKDDKCEFPNIVQPGDIIAFHPTPNVAAAKALLETALPPQPYVPPYRRRGGVTRRKKSKKPKKKGTVGRGYRR